MPVGEERRPASPKFFSLTKVMGKEMTSTKEKTTVEPVVAGIKELLAAATADDVYEVTRLLASFEASGLTVSSGDPTGRTGLHAAAAAGSVTVVKFLLTKKAHPNARGKFCPLQAGVEHTDPQC